jgi:hypothetical protein
LELSFGIPSESSRSMTLRTSRMQTGDYWQAAHQESFLDPTSRRVAFFFHYLDLTKTLETSFRPLALLEPSPRPGHSGFMRWLPP